jgi:hypothetical protein
MDALTPSVFSAAETAPCCRGLQRVAQVRSVAERGTAAAVGVARAGDVDDLRRGGGTCRRAARAP